MQEPGLIAIKRALISATNKDRLDNFALILQELYGVEIVSTGGTFTFLQKAGIKVREVSDVTGFPECMDGRLKTIHPRIAGGLLAVRTSQEHMKVVDVQGIYATDLLVVNLYNFVETTRKPGVKFSEIVENIDIGGPTMLRAAAKNYPFVAVVTHPDDYIWILGEMDLNHGCLTLNTRFELAKKVFQITSRYETAIDAYLQKFSEPPGD